MTLRSALELVAGALELVIKTKGVAERTEIKFTGRWAHYGTRTIGSILEASSNALELPAGTVGTVGLPLYLLKDEEIAELVARAKEVMTELAGEDDTSELPPVILVLEAEIERRKKPIGEVLADAVLPGKAH
jgi:hypothetical protein